MRTGLVKAKNVSSWDAVANLKYAKISLLIASYGKHSEGVTAAKLDLSSY